MNRPKAVDFLNDAFEREEHEQEEGVEEREFSEEEPVVVELEESDNSKEENESDLEDREAIQSTSVHSSTLPSGAISKDEEDYWAKKTRSGGAYIPPARLAMLQRSINDRSSEAFQRVTWDALKKSLNGLINKVNVSNLQDIVVELFRENLVRGRGLLVRACLKAQSGALPFTPVYAALIAVLNTKLPDIGELCLKRLIVQFRRSYKRNDKGLCLASVMFLAHLVNQRVAHEIVALQLLTLLLEQVTDDGVEIAVAFMKECGSFLAEHSPKPSNAIFERFRTILHEGSIDKRVQYMIEVLFQIRKDRFKDLPALKEDLDLVEVEDQTTHFISLDDEEIDCEENINVFRFDDEFLSNEEMYNEIKTEILGEDEEESREEAVAQASTSSATDETPTDSTIKTSQEIADMTGTNLINLRKTIYLTIMSSVDFEECGHKLLKIALPAGLESELTNMLIECCSQERSYLKFYGLLGERFAKINPIWSDAFLASFSTVYGNIHRLETNRIRNVAKFFGHMFATDALPWSPALSPIELTEEATTSASRIFLKFLFQELAEFFGCPKLLARFYSPDLRRDFVGLFPQEGAKELRFSINFFTAIGLGPLTELMRERLKEINVGDEGAEESEEEEENEIEESEEEGEALDHGLDRNDHREMRSDHRDMRSDHHEMRSDHRDMRNDNRDMRNDHRHSYRSPESMRESHDHRYPSSRSPTNERRERSRSPRRESRYSHHGRSRRSPSRSRSRSRSRSPRRRHSPRSHRR